MAKVKEITSGKLCDVVYDGIGKDTFPASLDCLRPLGYFVSFGSASGQIAAFNINMLQAKGSLFATRPTLNHYAAKREDLVSMANDLFKVVGSGAVKIPTPYLCPQECGPVAHRISKAARPPVPSSSFRSRCAHERKPTAAPLSWRRWPFVFQAPHPRLVTGR